MSEIWSAVRGVNCRKLLFGIPSLLSVALTLFITYVYYFDFLADFSENVSITA